MMKNFWILRMIPPYWKIYWPPCQKIYTLHQKKMYKVFIRNTGVGMQQQGRPKLYYAEVL
ncbi:Uncharacterised protein [Salmonella enterica subsp. enterica]|nr:Uncharacterised protein [Salmonella enterica subsp. enterica] [Salmonella enterica subsp. enterica serovar Menston]